eukprot:gene17862-21296_t
MFPSFFQMPFTYVITISIFIVSIIGFYHKPLYHALLFHPYEVFRGKRIHTLLTSAFVHKGWKHLLINLYIFYIMAKDVETLILNENYSPVQIKIIWLFIFLFSAVLSNLITGWLQKDNINYTSVGASGITFSFTIFAMLYFPLDHSNKPHKFLPLYYGYDYTFAILAICIAMGPYWFGIGYFVQAGFNHRNYLPPKIQVVNNFYFYFPQPNQPAIAPATPPINPPIISAAVSMLSLPLPVSPPLISTTSVSVNSLILYSFRLFLLRIQN